MTDLTAENPPHAGGGSDASGGMSDEDLNAQLDVDMAEALEADRFGSAEPSASDEGLDSDEDPVD